MEILGVADGRSTSAISMIGICNLLRTSYKFKIPNHTWTSGKKTLLELQSLLLESRWRATCIAQPTHPARSISQSAQQVKAFSSYPLPSLDYPLHVTQIRTAGWCKFWIMFVSNLGYCSNLDPAYWLSASSYERFSVPSAMTLAAWKTRAFKSSGSSSYRR